MTPPRSSHDLVAHLRELLPRYVRPLPRYTSYPTAPVWSEAFGARDFAAALGRVAGDVALYAHVPFCRSLCHFCACNRMITRDPALPARYVETLAREVETVRALVPGDVRAAQLHLGGGTPTHLDPAQLERVVGSLTAAFPLRPGAEVSIEVDPRVTTAEHVDALRRCGFDRVSLGVQDFEPAVQEAIHRVQPREVTAGLVDALRGAGIGSIAFDLIYGLPFQTVASFERTLAEVVALAPDRVAIYSYAHVTWVAKQQRGFERKDLPDAATKLDLFALALERLIDAGYVYIGLDHFAKPSDELARALDDGSLRRNFMGYTTQAGLDLVGFGPSAISELAGCYAQSHRELDAWEGAVDAGGLATLRGHALDAADEERRFLIARVLCQGAIDAADASARFGASFAERHADALRRLAPMERDGLVVLAADGSLRLTPEGRVLARNVAAVFDAYLTDGEAAGAEGAPRRFSQSV
ncbi:MAG: oxygen-independent coproporphyrinogen III oxidase [Myxococcota bacterium]